MGVVYRGFDPRLERQVAIKTIKLDLTPAERDEFEARFFREAKSSARLSHPNIVTVYDAGEVGNIAYIAMEFLEGRDLRQLMTKGQPTPPQLVVDIIAGVADGLAYAHRQGIVHRDVKPANIMVLRNGGVKLADFGIAQLQTGNKTQTQALLGTPRYMAPEQIAGQPVDGRADIFSLGVVLYQLLTGESPFDGDTMTTVMYQVIYEPAAPPTQLSGRVPPGFDYILSKALAKKPENRYQTSEELANDLRRYRKLAKTVPLPWEVGGISDLPQVDKKSESESLTGTSPAKVAVPRPSEPVKKKKKTQEKPRWIPALLAGLLAFGGIVFWTIRSAVPEQIVAAQPAASPAPASPPLVAAPVEETLSIQKPTATEEDQLPAAASEVKPATVALAVSPWGEVFVDGKSKGVSPPLAKLQLAPGKHRIDIKNAGAKPYTKEVDLQDGETIRLKHKF